MRHALASLAVLIASVSLIAPAALAASADGTRLLRQPDAAAGQVVFAYGADLWIASRTAAAEGAVAPAPRRLTAFPGVERDPKFSPDGTLVAFTGEYDGNVDVYVVPAAGGTPRRLTWHPDQDVVRGWTPDGRVLFYDDPGCLLVHDPAERGELAHAHAVYFRHAHEPRWLAFDEAGFVPAETPTPMDFGLAAVARSEHPDALAPLEARARLLAAEEGQRGHAPPHDGQAAGPPGEREHAAEASP